MASGQRGVLVHVHPEESDALVGRTEARLMMHGRSMRSWLRVDIEQLDSERELARWVELGTACARSLPAKR